MPQKSKTRSLTIIGLLSALVFASSWIQIPIVFGGADSRIHLGNAFCALAGILFGPVIGGLSSGIGSMLFDFTNPLYISESPITFIMKFTLGFLVGYISHRKSYLGKNKSQNIIATTVGAFIYVVLYLIKTIIFKLINGEVWGAIIISLGVKGTSSTINAIAAIIVSVTLAAAIRPALDKSGIYEINSSR